LPAQSILTVELMIRPDNMPLRLNGSGMLLLNPPWQFDQTLAPALPVLKRLLGENSPATRLEWLRKPE
jgi:23S rRNA (adenine2030-N6)-methyltransferase